MLTARTLIRLMRVFAGRTLMLLVLSCYGSIMVFIWSVDNKLHVYLISLRSSYFVSLHFDYLCDCLLFQARMFQCEKCCKSYDRQSSLVKHSHVHNELKPFVCSICQKAFVYKDSLNQHKLTHTDVATAVCPICGKTFKQRASLSKHKSIHEPAKYTCDSCGRKFYRKEFLLAHLKTHGDKKQCSACKARVFHLDKHICKMERREPQHQCPVCEKRFQQKRYLTEHIKSTHTKTRLFVCIKCNKTFNYRASLHNHNKYCMLQNQNHAIETNAPSTENEFTTEDIAQSDTHAPATV